MNFENIFSEIESLESASQLNVASGFRVFREILEIQPTSQELIEIINSVPSYSQNVFNRFLELIDANASPGYAHSEDVALATYLYILSQTNQHLAIQAVHQALNTPQLWWARLMAVYIDTNTSITIRIDESEHFQDISNIKIDWSAGQTNTKVVA